ncbi:DUF1521 domain-containing protein [Sphingomonas crocodyli]|nr:DUF1521 domain-containing protein [Sphingomonas crocodyli]
MTTINANLASTMMGSSFAAGFSAGAQFMMASGIAARFLSPLGAGPLAFAMMPALWNVSARNAAAAEPEAQWTASTGQNGTASIDLGDGYSLALNENNSEITITNANTGETTRIWGDPHVEVDGNHVFDFWGTTTFTLDNGTKITIDTEQFGGNPDAYVASQLTITKGDNAIVVDGISQNDLGDLSISMSQDGYALDAATRDGFVLNENASGSGWRSDITGQIATQADLNATRPGEAYGPGSTMPSVDELSSALSMFLGFGVLMSMAMLSTENIDTSITTNAILRAILPQVDA